MKLKAVKGTRDLRGEDIRRLRYLLESADRIFPLYGYEEIKTPIMEKTELFTHSVGQNTDIVGKEMYILADRRGRSLALRPEGTAPVVRSAITNNLTRQNKFLRFFYSGSMFRYEQPQKGRYREFHQLGAEYFGVATPDADLELILMLRHYFEAINLASVSFHLNTVGCQNPDCRPAFKKKLVDFLRTSQEAFCGNCRRRLEENPLRAFDCKTPECVSLTQDAPKIYENVCGECADHFSELTGLLKRHDVSFTLNPRLVRGLDYYTRTVFEIFSDNLGAQNAAGGGGRFDGLFETLGADSFPAIGFALGLDRLSLLIDLPEKEEPLFFVIGHDREAISLLLARCRAAGVACRHDPFQSSIKSQFRQANRLKASKVFILGEEELKNNQISVKDMRTGEQITTSLDEVGKYFH